MRRLATATVLAAVVMTAPACTRIRNNIGYVVDESLVASIQPGVDNRASVQGTLGRPSAASQWDDVNWYYISRNTRQFAFRDPAVDLQSILIVSFDAKGNVAKVERRGKDQIADISPDSDKTPTLGRKGGLLQDLFGNIGRTGIGAPVGGGEGGGPNGS